MKLDDMDVVVMVQEAASSRASSAKEYATTLNEDGLSSTTYIEAKIGAEYFVRCTNTRPQPTILKRLSTGITKALNCMKATVSIDGQAATTSRLVTVGSVKHLRLRSAGGTVQQNFVFCAPHVTDDGISCSSKLKDVGSIVVVVREYITSSISKANQDDVGIADHPYSTPAIGTDTKEGVFLTSTTRVSPRHIPKKVSTNFYYGRQGKVLHTFRFLYKTRDAMVADGIQPPPSPPSSIQLPATPPHLPSVPVAAELPIVPVAAEPVHVKAEGNPSVPKRMKLEHQGLPRNIALVSNNQVVDLTGDDSADDKAGGMSDLDIRKEACRQVKPWKSQLGDQYMAAVNLLSQGRYAHSFLAVDPTDQEDWLLWSLQQGRVKREHAIKGE